MRLQEDSRRKLTQLSQPATAYFDCVRQRQHCCTPSTAASKYQRLPSNNTSGRVADPAWAIPLWLIPLGPIPLWPIPLGPIPLWPIPLGRSRFGRSRFGRSHLADPALADPASPSLYAALAAHERLVRQHGSRARAGLAAARMHRQARAAIRVSQGGRVGTQRSTVG